MRWISISALLLVPFVGELGIEGQRVTTVPFELRIEISPPARLKGKVVLVNRSNIEARVWRMGNSWGDAALHFEATSNAASEQLTRKPQDYTRNVPSAVTIAPGGSLEIPFDLADGSWQPDSVVERLAVGPAAIEAVYLVSKSPETEAQQVWVGELHSQKLALK